MTNGDNTRTTATTSTTKDKNGVAVEIVTVTTEHAGSDRCCVFSTNLQEQPQIVAVNCAPEAVGSVRQCLEYVVNFQTNSQMVVPDRFRFTLHMDNNNNNNNNNKTKATSYSYFCCLQVSEPKHLDALYHQHMRLGVRPASVDMLIVMMPLFGSDDNTTSEFALPPAPDAKVRMRDHIKQVLEDRCASPNGWIRTLPGGRGGTTPKKPTKRRRTLPKKTKAVATKGRVKLGDALAHMEDWKVNWAGNEQDDADLMLKPREIQYLTKHASHFLAMAMDGVSPERAVQYVDQVCSQHQS